MNEPTHEHAALKETFASRRYFRKFEAITQHLGRVAAVMQGEGRLASRDVEILTRYIAQMSYTFKALGMKYLMVGRGSRLGAGLSMDRVESGFPVMSELMLMANDAQQAKRHLQDMPSADALKDEMVRKIVGEREVPLKLQYALSQRLYYEELLKGELFWARNDPRAEWGGDLGERRRKYTLHWAVYDSQINLPTVYIMELEDSGRTALPKDQRRWPEAQAHLMAQSMEGLKLLTIAKGFDEDFDDLHPKRLRRFHIGPMYSSAFTLQTGPMRDVLRDAKAPEGQDWALAWTIEELESERVDAAKSGWFGTVEREVFALDPFAGRGADTGATRMERAIIMPQRPYAALAELAPAGFSDVRKFVVNEAGAVLSV